MTRTSLRLLALAAGLLFAAQAAAGPARPSFSCRKAATPVQEAICANRELSKLDRQVEMLHKSVLARVSGAQFQPLQDEQDAFRDKLERCPAELMDTCLRGLYVDRDTELRNLVAETSLMDPCGPHRIELEEAICLSDELRREYAQLAETYYAVRRRLPESQPALLRTLQDDQAAWFWSLQHDVLISNPPRAMQQHIKTLIRRRIERLELERAVHAASHERRRRSR